MDNELFNVKVTSKSRNYFFDIKQSQRGDYYLIISESKKQEHGFARQQILVFNTLLTDFAAAFAQCMQKLSELDSTVIWDPRLFNAHKNKSASAEDLPASAMNNTRRYTALSAAEIEQEQLLNQRNGKPKNAGLRWSDDDREAVKQLFLNGDAISSIASSLGRSIPSISAELKKQGLLVEEPQAAGARPF